MPAVSTVEELEGPGHSSGDFNKQELAFRRHVEACEEMEGFTSISGVRWNPVVDRRISGGDIIGARAIQDAVIRKTFEIFGNETWEYGYNSKKRMRNVTAVLEAVSQASKHKIQHRTYRRWLTYYTQYGELPIDGRTKRKRSSRGRKSFTRNEKVILLNIVRDSPQLFLDEIADRLSNATNGKKWNHTTIWRCLVDDFDLSLQKVNFRARQMSEEDQALFYVTLTENVTNIEQIFIIDEAYKDRNAARRSRASSKRGVAPVLPSYVDEDFRKRYTMIGACNIHGFVSKACELVPRKEGEVGTVRTRIA